MDGRLFDPGLLNRLFGQLNRSVYHRFDKLLKSFAGQLGGNINLIAVVIVSDSLYFKICFFVLRKIHFRALGYILQFCEYASVFRIASVEIFNFVLFQNGRDNNFVHDQPVKIFSA